MLWMSAAIIGLALRFLSNEWKDTVEIKQKLPERVDHPRQPQQARSRCSSICSKTPSTRSAAKNSMATRSRPSRIEGRAVRRRKTIITIRDNGEGIETAVRDKIFDPFFTTKDVGEGMGLGLTICYRIVQEYEGRISVQSERGKFCEFKLEFPVQVM